MVIQPFQYNIYTIAVYAKDISRQTWMMCSVSGPMHHLLRQTRMSYASVFGFEPYFFIFTFILHFF